MKRLMKFMMSIAVAAISFTGCENNFEDVQKDNNGFELTVVADNVARTEYDATLQDIKWSTGDQGRILVKGVAKNLTATIDATDKRIASFSYSTELTAGDEVTIQGFAPTATVANEYDATETSGNRTRLNYVTIALPSVQSATTATFDKAADILVADDLTATITAAEATAGKKVVGNFHFRRQVAISEFTYTVTNAELLASDEKVDYVTFQVVSTANNKYLAGNMRFQPTADGAKVVNSTNVEIADNKDLFVGSKSNEIKVTLTDQPSLKNGFKAWFVTSPVTLAATDKLVFTIVTDAGTTITKTVDAVGKELSFSTTQKNTLGVTLNDAVEIERVEVASGVWQKVTSAMADYSGKYLIVYESGKVAFDGSNTADAVNNGVSVTISNSTIEATAAMDAIAFTIEPSTNAGKYYVKGVNGKYIGHGSYANDLTAGATKYDHTISIDASGNANLVVSPSGGNITLKYNYASDQKRFRYYKSGQQSVALYRFVEEGGSIPVTPVLNVVAQPEEVAAAGANVTVALTVANLTAEDITVTPSETWITNATVSGSNLTFTVEANDTEETREATITLTSGDLTATVDVSQAAKEATGGEGGSGVSLGTAYTYTFTSSQFNATTLTKTLGTLSWTLDYTKAASGTHFGSDSTKGQQLGSSTNSYSEVTLTTTAYDGGVKTIKINTSGASSTNAKFIVTVGGTQIGSQVSLTSTATEYTFSSDEILTGDIVLTWTQTSKKAIYVKSIKIN